MPHARWFFWLICLAVSWHPYHVSAQSKTDSLWQQLRKVRRETRVDVLNQLAFEYIAHDAAKAESYCTQAITLAKELDYHKGYGTALIYCGVNAYLSGDFLHARKDLMQGLGVVKEINDRTLEGYAYLQIANSFLNQTELDSGLHYYNLAYQILKDSTNPLNLSKLYRNLGTLYGLRSDVVLQEKYILKALRIRGLLGNKQMITDAFIELARLHIRNMNLMQGQFYIAKADSVLRYSQDDLENRNDLRHVQALLLFNKGKPDDAFALLDSALTYYSKTGLALKNLWLHMDLGLVFADRSEYELALKNYYAALRIAESKSFVIEKTDLWVRLGWVNYHLGEYEQAQALAEKSITETRKRNLVARTANGLTLLGVTFTEQRKFEDAKKVLNEALDIRKLQTDTTKISEGYMNLAYLFEQEKNFPEAIRYYQESLRHGKFANSEVINMWTFLGLGNIALQQRKYNEAKGWFTRVEQQALKLHAGEVLIRVYTGMRELHKEQRSFERSLWYAERVEKMKDSLHRGDLSRRFANLQKMNEIERRDQDIQALQRERTIAQEKIEIQQAKLKQQYGLIAVSIAAIVLLAVIAVVYARFFGKVKRLNQTIQEKNLSIQEQADRLTEANSLLEKLYRSVTEQKEELQSQSEELAESYHQIRALNENLQALVDENTKDLVRANEELLRQNGELQQFSYSVSHNLRGPVARILGLAELANNATREEELKEYNSLIRKSSHDLDRVLRDLSKIIDVRNEFHLSREMVDLQEEWDKSVDLLHERVPIDTKLQCHFEVKSIYTVRAVIHSIFHNLLSNALKYRSDERSLIISVGSKATSAGTVIHFRDNGLGIDMNRYGDLLFKLFKRFHNHVEGRGIGLYLVKWQVESLGGTIQLTSEPGRGTQFEITLPVLQSEPVPTLVENKVHTS